MASLILEPTTEGPYAIGETISFRLVGDDLPGIAAIFFDLSYNASCSTTTTIADGDTLTVTKVDGERRQRRQPDRAGLRRAAHGQRRRHLRLRPERRVRGARRRRAGRRQLHLRGFRRQRRHRLRHRHQSTIDGVTDACPTRSGGGRRRVHRPTRTRRSRPATCSTTTTTRRRHADRHQGRRRRRERRQPDRAGLRRAADAERRRHLRLRPERRVRGARRRRAGPATASPTTHPTATADRDRHRHDHHRRREGHMPNGHPVADDDASPPTRTRRSRPATCSTTTTMPTATR